MKNFRTQLLVLLTFSTFYSCKKETITNTRQSIAATTSDDAVTGEKWWGDYIASREYPPSRTFADKHFIANGYARIYTDTVRIHPWNYYSTIFKLKIPASKNIDGDNITFEVGVKNPSNSSFYIPYHGRDVGLSIKGETDSASINNVVPDSIRDDAYLYATMQIGANRINNVTQLQYLFEDWGTLVLQTFNNGLVAYRNNEYLRGLPYNGAPKIGTLREIKIGFKGSGYLDWVKLYNSATGELIMSEDFNTDGQSSVVWY